MASTTKGEPKPRSATKRATKSTATATAVATEPHAPTHDQIAARAHELFVASGYQSDRELEFWLEAERQLREASNA